MEQSPSWEATSRSASQQIPRLLWNPLPCSKLSATGPNPERDESTPHLPPYFPQIRFNTIFPSTSRSSKLYPPFRFFQPKYCMYSNLSHLFHTHRLYHPPWFESLNNIWWSIQITKVVIMQSSPAPRHALPLRSKCSPKHLFLKHPQSIFFFLVWETKFHTHTKQQAKLWFCIF